jgi:hypothetical protein
VRAPLRGRSAHLPLLVALLAALAQLLGAPAAAAAEDSPYHADRVVVVGVPGLVWSDVTAEQTPAIRALAEDAAIGALSVRAARSTTCLIDGWATLGAGNRARFPGPEDSVPPVPLPTVPLPDGEAAPPTGDGEPAAEAADVALAHCGLQQLVARIGFPDPVATVRRIGEDEATRRFGAEPGALGAAVGCAGVVGTAPTVAVARAGVELTRETGCPPARPWGSCSAPAR